MADEDTPLISSPQLEASSAPNDYDTVYNDESHHITLGRRIARRLSKHSWYYPHPRTGQDHASRPSLDAAWAYFEHVTLTRHFLPEANETNLKPEQESRPKDFLRKAEPGERDRPTRLYNVLTTAESDLADFGVGVGVYFFTLRSLCIIMLLAGIINIPSLMYFGSDSYNGVTERTGHWRALQTSAICSDSTWVACPTCTKDEWRDHFPATYDRYAGTTTTEEGGLTFILRRNCQVSHTVAMVAYVSLLFVCVSVYILQKITKRRERYFDESAQTTTDYAIEVVNPPWDARNAQEWRDFFQRFGHVTCGTVALDNEELIAALVTRRELLATLENLQPAGVVMDPNDIQSAVEMAEPIPWYCKLICAMDAQTLQVEIEKLNVKILTDLAKRQYDVSNVFIVFETEHAQQEALRELAVLGIDKLRNNTSALPSDLLFRGEKVLDVREPPEPSSVRWKDLDESVMTQLKQRIVTSFLTILIIIGSCILVTYMRYKHGIVYAALTVSAVNSIAPAACEYMTQYESHSNEGSRQSSLYFKITACLWINTAIITAFITPFVDTLNDDRSSLIPSMLAIFITEMFKAPVMQLLDIGGHVKRHVLGPRAVDQKRMNIYFMGTAWSLSERYTDMTNVLFLTFYYALLFPAGFFFAAATLAIHYLVDKYCLLRNWEPAPLVGSSIADMSRIYFFSSAIAIYAVVSSYNFASFPYDNACEDDTTVSSKYVGTFDAVSGKGNVVTVHISQGDANYFYCNQDMMHFPAFPAIPSNQPVGGEWMSDEQSFAVVFGWTSLVIVVLVMFIFLNALRRLLAPIFVRVVKRHVHTSEFTSEPFSEILDIFAYVPQVRLASDPFPVLLCDVSGIDHELIGWEDPDAPYEKHSAIHDLAGLECESVFSIIQHWPPSKDS